MSPAAAIREKIDALPVACVSVGMTEPREAWKFATGMRVAKETETLLRPALEKPGRRRHAGRDLPGLLTVCVRLNTLGL